MKCKACKFYEPGSYPSGQTGKMVPASDGICQRYPGTTRVTQDDWCGEFKAKKGKAKK